METASEPLAALQASLASVRDWRNIQQTLMTSITRISTILHTQSQQIDAMAKRIAQLETSNHVEIEQLAARITQTYQRQSQTEQQQQMSQVSELLYASIAAQSTQIEQRLHQQIEGHKESHRVAMDTVHNELHKLRSVPPPPPPIDSTELEGLGRRVKRVERQVREMESSVVSQCAVWRQEIHVALETKASRDDVDSLLKARASDEEVRHIEAIVRQLREEIATNTNTPPPATPPTPTKEAPNAECIASTQAIHQVAQVKTHVHELLRIIEKMQAEQAALQATATANARSTDQQSETKSAVLKLHEAVRSVRRSVETVAKRSELEALGEQLAWVRRQLRTEIFQARYIWKQGRPTQKQWIAWNAQAVNSNTDVFVWHGATRPDVVTTVVPGLYHLQAAFFTSETPTLQLYVNGEPALIQHTRYNDDLDTNTNTQVVVAKTTETPCVRRRRFHHSAGEIVGVEITAFLALPPRAALAIGYDMDEMAQGFLNLRKL